MMKALSEILSLPPALRRRVFRAVAVIGCVRLALWLLPFTTVQRFVERLGRRSPAAGQTLTPEHVDGRAAIVRLGSGVVPRATCLTQALALQVLLGRAGTTSALRIGVASNGTGIDAHAWLECDGRVIIGGEQMERYTPLLTLTSSTQ